MTGGRLVTGLSLLLLGGGGALAQRIEIGPIVGGLINGGVDYTTANYTRADIGNGFTYGFTAGYSLSSSVQVEFEWSRATTDLLGTPKAGGANTKVFALNTGHYFGNFVFHLRGHEERLRPFLLVGAGGTRFAPDAPNTTSFTRPSFGFGGGAKYNIAKRVNFRAQLRWLPVNMYTSGTNTWCGPVTGCWSMGHSHYLHSVEIMTGLGFRF